MLRYIISSGDSKLLGSSIHQPNLYHTCLYINASFIHYYIMFVWFVMDERPTLRLCGLYTDQIPFSLRISPRGAENFNERILNP